MRAHMQVMERIPLVIVLLIVADSLHAQGYYDCYDVWNGPNLPNSVCTTRDGDAGTWNLNCVCVPNKYSFDCNGVMNGGAFPGTMCQWTNDSITYRPGIWSPNCTCDNDSLYMMKDCPGVSGGHAWPGTPCIIPGSAVVGEWSPNCVCEAAPPVQCVAQPWIVQAQRPDSMPMPYVLWIWDLSQHGGGNLTYHWDFGDGTTSEERYVSHTYTDSGPYELCLTLDDGKGCTSRKCGTVSVDNDGIFNGLVAVMDHAIGFTVTVPCLKGQDLVKLPVCDGLYIASPTDSAEPDVRLLSRGGRTITVSIIGMDGRSLASERRRLVTGKNEWRIARGSVPSGTWLMRITDGPKTIAQRLVRFR